jgi:phytanoyl-CoA hydroxylase
MTTTRTVTMPEDVSEETIQLYHEQGFVHLPRVFDPGEVAFFRTAAQDLLAKESPFVWGTEEQTQVHVVKDVWQKSQDLRGLALHPRLARIAERLAGGPLRLYGIDVLSKEPHKHLPTMVHDDELGLPMSNGSRALTAWIALVDVPVERGCLGFVPRSHLRHEADRQPHISSFAECREIDDVWPDFRWQPRITVPVRAGDVTFHHFRTVHMAGSNQTDARRLSSTVVYIDHDARYRPGVQDQSVAHLKPGQLIDGEDFPLISPAE